MSLNKRKLQYALAINEALSQMMTEDPSVFIIGQGVKSPWYVGNTCNGLLEKFGEKRVIDTPVSENAVTGAGIGAALIGMRPVIVHPRMDFMAYAFEPIINEAANWSYMFGGKSWAPAVIWGIVNRGGEQAAQHSQALQSTFSHIPGLKVVMPSTPYDAKGLMISAIRDNNPVIYIDDRWLYQEEGQVPQSIYSVPIGKGIIRKSGKDITIVGISYMARQAEKAAEILAELGIDAEVIDIRSAKPLDVFLIGKSVKKTGKILVADGGWITGGIAGEIIAKITEKFFSYLKVPPKRIGLPDVPAPMSSSLEKEYYKNAQDIVIAVKTMFQNLR